MKQTASRKIHFCYGHRVMNHESKCATLHGHNGIIWIYATPCNDNSNVLDDLGRVIDFSVLKEKIGSWVEKFWDHTLILNKQDTKTIELVKQAPAFKDIFILPNNPTAENLSSYILNEVCPKELKGSGVLVYKVVFYETENCFCVSELSQEETF